MSYYILVNAKLMREAGMLIADKQVAEIFTNFARNYERILEFNFAEDLFFHPYRGLI